VDSAPLIPVRVRFVGVRGWGLKPQPKEDQMAEESVYRVTEVVGVSGDSWEQAARNAVETVGASVRDLRVAEVVREDVTIEDGKISAFRVRLGVSFKYEKE
jgi:flavin-binding protein dodecin